MLFFQLFILIFTTIFGKNKYWVKYVLVINALVWYLWLQKRLHMPNSVGFLLLEFLIISVTDIWYIWHCIRKKRAESLEKENSILQEQMSLYQLRIQQNEDYRKRIYSIQHDLKNQLIGFHALLVNGDYDEARKSIEEELGKVSESPCPECGDLVLDHLISCKAAVAREKQIPVDINIGVSITRKPDSVKMAVAMGNLLDNAIEACEKVPKEKRYIRINMCQKDSRIFIEIENPFSGEIKIDKTGSLVTTKTNSALHGYGIRAVEKALENFGDFVYRIEGNTFFSILILYQ